MAVIQANTVNCTPCDDCPRERCIVTERINADRLQVVVLSGCESCEGSTLSIPAR